MPDKRTESDAAPDLTERDRDILAALVLRVRVFTVGQVGRTWFAGTADPPRHAARRLRRLAAAGWVEIFTMKARPELELTEPLLRWRPGEPAPDFCALARQLAARWREPIVPTPVVISTAAAGTRMGGSGGRRPRLSEISHDIVLAGVYLHWRATSATHGGEWLSEAQLARLGFGRSKRLPDAMTRVGPRRVAVEVGGAYPPAKLADFHDFCVASELDYELW